MAGDWIKMRVDLQTHPKIVRILSATGTDKFRVIGGLHAVWAVFDTHSTDGALKGYTPELLDHVIGWQGFSRAMESVGWLLFDGLETLALPEFDSHNGQSAKRRAEDQKRKKNSRVSPQSVRNLSANPEDKTRTREEKRREEKKEQKKEAHLTLPPWLPEKTWTDFCEHRNSIKKPMSAQAVDRMLTLLTGLHDKGTNIVAAIDQSIRNGWQDVFEPKAKVVAANDGASPASMRALT